MTNKKETMYEKRMRYFNAPRLDDKSLSCEDRLKGVPAALEVEALTPLIKDYYSHFKLEEPKFFNGKNGSEPGPKVYVFDSPYAGWEFIADFYEFSKEDRDMGIVGSPINGFWAAPYIEDKLQSDTDRWYYGFHPFDTAWLLPEIAVVARRPIVFNLQDDGNEGFFHKIDEAAIEYSDGGTTAGEKGNYVVGMVDGRTVPFWLVQKEARDLTLADFHSLKNVEHQRVFIRKAGPAPLLDAAKLIHKDSFENRMGKHEYELYNINIDGTDLRFLKMLNPSTGDVHLEEVHPDCKTVAEAYAFRTVAGSEMYKDLKIHSEGMDWEQQGDMIFIPLEALSEAQGGQNLGIKPFPVELQ